MSGTAKSQSRVNVLREYRERWMIPASANIQAATVLEKYAEMWLAGDHEKVVDFLGYEPMLVPLQMNVDEATATTNRHVTALGVMFTQVPLLRILACEQLLKGLVYMSGNEVEKTHVLRNLHGMLPPSLKAGIERSRGDAIQIVRKSHGPFVPDPNMRHTLNKCDGSWNRLRYGPENWSSEVAAESFLQSINTDEYCNLLSATEALNLTSLKVLGEFLGLGKTDGSYGLPLEAAKPLSAAWKAETPHAASGETDPVATDKV